MNQEETWLLKEKYHGDANAEGFRTDCLRLAHGEPLAYIIGAVPFLNTTIFLDSHPLIPRPETEFWVEKAITEIQLFEEGAPRVLDLCAGSGCIGIGVLHAIPSALVDFVEIDAIHHEIIKKNIHANTITPEHTRIYGGSLFERVTDTYDFILTNPPYIDASLNRVDKSVSAYEPAGALYGGVGGTDIITRIMTDVSPFLSPLGVLYIEHDPEQSVYIRDISSKRGYACHTYPDQYGVLRYTRITRISTKSVTQ